MRTIWKRRDPRSRPHFCFVLCGPEPSARSLPDFAGASPLAAQVTPSPPKAPNRHVPRASEYWPAVSILQATPKRAQNVRPASGRSGGDQTGHTRHTMASFDDAGPRGSGPMRATVKWFNPTKGFGFVTLEDGTDAFCHASALASLPSPNLPQGATVMCDVGAGPARHAGDGCAQRRQFDGRPVSRLAALAATGRRRLRWRGRRRLPR